MKGWRGGRFAIFCWREGFSLYKVVELSLLPSHLPSLWFSVSRTVVKALEILEPSAPSLPEMPSIRFPLLLLRALALKKPVLSSHHLHTEDKKSATNLRNKTMTQLSQGKSVWNQLKLSYLGSILGHEPWVRLQGPGALLELSVWQGWSLLTSWSSLSCQGCSPWLEFSRELPHFIHIQFPCLDLPQLVLA